MNLSRRNFLSLTLTSGLIALYNNQIFANSNFGIQKKKVLILIEMRGGNDGLNTIIPYKNSIYFSQRPNISINNSLKLNSELALNPMMKSLIPLWDKKQLTFALGVGWPNPNRSHFMAMDQWSTGNESGIGEGWLAKISDSINNQEYLLSLGPTGSNAVEGSKVNSLHFLGKEKNSLRNSSYTDEAILSNRKSLKTFLEIDQFSTNKIIDLNIVVTSEFGRRLKENGSNGTDHGNASVAFIIGDAFNEKFIGKYPDLKNLDNRGDLIPNITPTNLYKYIQKKIWG